MPRVSAEAVALLQHRLAGDPVAINDLTRPLYRDLVGAGAMIPINTFLGGPEGVYRLTLDAPLIANGGFLPNHASSLEEAHAYCV